MSDYISIKNAIRQLNDNDRLVLNKDPNNEAPNSLKVSNEHKYKFTIFNAQKKSENERIRQENIETANLIARAIKGRFGREVYSGMIDKLINSGSKVSVKKLKIVFATFDKFEKTACKNVVRDSISSYSMSKTDAKSIKYENRMLQKLGMAPNKVSDLFNQTDYRLSGVASTTKDLTDQNTALEYSKAKLVQLATDIEMEVSQKRDDLELVEYGNSVKSNINKLINTINDKQQHIASELNQNPHLVKNVKVAFDNVFQAAILTLNSIGEKFVNNGQEIPREIQDFIYKISEQRLQLFAGKNENDVADKDILDVYKNYRVNLKKELAHLHRLFDRADNNQKLSAKDITDIYVQNFVKTLNNNPESWKVISKKISLPAFGKTSVITSNILPAINLSLLKNNMDGVRGVGSNDRSNPHASNLAVTNLVNNDGQVIFSGVRHGANCAFGIENEQERRQVNAERTKEVFLAGLESRPDLKASALEGNVVELPVVSTALLSPGHLVGPAKTDAKLLTEQSEAWTNACNHEGICEITVRDENGNDKVIRVKPKVIKFNFGINFLSHTVLGKALSLGGGWKKSDRMLKAGINELIGKDNDGNNLIGPDSLVGKYLSNNPDLGPKKFNQISLLVQQIREMVKNEDYKKNSIDPSALPARIIYLAYLVGAVPCFNCKSGKDRTGEVDAAVKALAFELDAGHKPKINPADAAEDKKVNLTMLRDCGNFEMQKYNTGFEGYKLEHADNSGFLNKFIGLKGLADLFDNKESLKYFTGTSKGNIV